MSDNRKNNFDLVRLIAALSVLLSHQHALTGLPEPAIFGVTSLGGFGVLIFFTISGFLVAQSWDADPSAHRFAIKRLLRIWPGFAVVIILAAVVLGPLLSELPLREYYRSPIFWDYFSNLRFSLRDQLPMQFKGNPRPDWINGSLWTIPLELKCYLMLLALGIFRLLKKRTVLPSLTLIAATAYFTAETQLIDLSTRFQWSRETNYLLQFGLFFFAGASLYKLGINADRKKAAIALAACWAAGLLALGLGKPLAALWIVVPVTVLVIGNASTPLVRDAGRYGDLSFGIYIYAFPVQQTMIWFFHGRLPWTTVLIMTILATATLAFLSWHLVEKRALTLKPRPRLANASAQGPVPGAPRLE